MDWRNNTWVGVGAAALLVIGIAAVFYYVTGGESALDKATGETFQCDACGAMFTISMREYDESEEAYLTYFGKAGRALPCRECGEEKAYKVYYCVECEEYFKYTPEQGTGLSDLTCPEGHLILMEHH